MPTLKKKEKVQELNEKFSRALGVVQADYRGITAMNMDTLRAKLRKEKVELYVVKNRLAKIAVKGTKVEGLDANFKGPMSVAISYDNPVAPARILTDYAKVDEKLKILGGYAEGDLFDAVGVKKIGALPDKPILQATYLSALTGPTRNFVFVTSGVLRKFLYLMNAVKEKREKDPEFKGGEMSQISTEDVKNHLNNLSVLKLVELTKQLEEEWGVSAAAPVAVAAPAAGGAAAAAEEKTEFNVTLASAGGNKIQVIKVIRELTNLGLKEAKDLVDGAPKVVKEKVAKDVAEDMKKKLEAAGATVEVK